MLSCFVFAGSELVGVLAMLCAVGIPSLDAKSPSVMVQVVPAYHLAPDAG